MPRRPIKPPTSNVIKQGDILIFANKKEAKVINLLWLNGQRGIQLDVKDALFFDERFRILDEVEHWINDGLWSVRKGE